MAGGQYDYVIVGGGTAGCVLANRLTADPAVSVLVLEAGPAWRGLQLRIPAAVSMLYQGGRYHWRHRSEPETFAAGQRLPYKMGRILGGSSAINGMIWVRGNPADFDGWAAAGCTGWSWADVAPIYRQIEDFEDPADSDMGHGGPIAVARGDIVRAPLNRAFVEAGAQAGFPLNDNHNGRDQIGFGAMHRNTRRGARSDVHDGYLAPVRRRPNLHIQTDATVERIVIESGHAVAVAYRQGGRSNRAEVGREVLLCAGALGSPQLLQLSGIGAPDHVGSLGLDVRQALPGVGSNLHTHPVIKLSYACLKPVSVYPWTRPPRSWLAGALWLLGRWGPAGSNHMEVGAFLRSRPDLIQPDLIVTLVPITFDGIFGTATRHGFDIYVELIGCRSRGSTMAVSTDPEVSPSFRFNFLEDPRDIEALRRSAQIVRDLVNQPAFAPYRGEELSPGAAVSGAAEVDRWLRESVAVTHHLAGTCRMGPADDPLAVVGPDLRVHGIAGLRVADASIMPTVVSGNTHAAVIMIGERAADIMLSGAGGGGRP